MRPPPIAGLKTGLFGAVLLGLAYHLLALYEVRNFIRHSRKIQPAGFTPPVTVLKPVARWDGRIYANLLSFCQQDYPNFRMVIGVKGPASNLNPPPNFSPCVPGAEVKLVPCSEGLAVNPKVNQLIQVEGELAGDLVVVSDDDIRVGPDYLVRAVWPFREPNIGAVTCLYVCRQAPTWAAAVEALAVNVDFVSAVLVARRLFGVKYALGASLALRRSLLAKLGGFRSLGEYLADDYQLGRRVLARGFRLALAPYVVENTLPAMDLALLFRHQVRWGRTNRVCQPVGWFFSVVTHLLVWTLGWGFSRSFDGASWKVMAGVLAFRLAEAYLINRELAGLRPFWKYAWRIPFKDLFSFGIWALSFTGRRVHWAGRDYLVSADGRMRPAAS